MLLFLCPFPIPLFHFLALFSAFTLFHSSLSNPVPPQHNKVNSGFLWQVSPKLGVGYKLWLCRPSLSFQSSKTYSKRNGSACINYTHRCDTTQIWQATHVENKGMRTFGQTYKAICFIWTFQNRACMQWICLFCINFTKCWIVLLIPALFEVSVMNTFNQRIKITREIDRLGRVNYFRYKHNWFLNIALQ